MSIVGPCLADQAFKQGLIDVCHYSVFPVVVDDGNNAVPKDMHFDLHLRVERQVEVGVVYLQDRTASIPDV